jgi:plastocyanin
MDHPISIKGMKYNPPSITIAKGDTVTWTNDDGMTHTATAPYPIEDPPYKWDTGDIKKGASKSITFKDAAWAGSYGCQFHGNMKGTINIS